MGLLVSNAIKLTFKRIHVSLLITSFELMEAVLTICSVSLRLIVIYRMSPPKSIDLKLECKTDVLEADLIGVNIDRECTDVNLVVRQYDASLSSLLDKHAPSKRIYVVERPMNDWMTDDILVLKALRRKYESLWRKTRLTVHFDMYSESCMDVKLQLVIVNLRYCKRKYQTAKVSS